MPLEVSVRDGMVPVAAGQSFFEALHALGISAVEIWINPDGGVPLLKEADGSAPYSVNGADEIAELRSRLNAESVTVAALLLPTDYSGANAAEHVEWSIQAVRAAALLGAPVVRIDTATAADISMEESRDNFVRAMKHVLAETEDTAVDLGIENHGTVSNNPEFLDGVFERVPDARLGMTLDTGNFYWYGFPLNELYTVLEHFAPRARHTHVKNINYPADIVETTREKGYEYDQYCCPLDEGNISMARVGEILQGAGYARTLCIENEALHKYPVDDRAEIIRRDAAVLRAVQCS
jgi:sugar phosphate isomerase/epimerase